MNDIETFVEPTPQPDENAKIIIEHTTPLEEGGGDFASTPVPLQKVKKPLSEARKKGLAKANQTRKRNARMRQEARDDENAKRYLDKMAREEEAFATQEIVKQNVTKKTQSVHESSDSDSEETQSDYESPVKKTQSVRKRRKKAKKRGTIKKVRAPSISESESESDSSDDDERIEREVKQSYKEKDYSYKRPEPYKLNFA